MTNVLQFGDRVVDADEIPTLLKRYDLLPKFLEGVAIDEAIADHACSDEEKQQALFNICQQHQLATPEQQQAWMNAKGFTIADVEALATRPLRIQKFKEEKWGKKVRRHFMERKPGLDQIIYSLIRVQDEGLAHELYYRILEGETTFEECAAHYSQGPEARTGGKLGPVPLNRPHPVISKVLSVSQPGQLWPPRTIAEWFIIVRLEEFHAAQLDEPMRQALLEELYNTWLQSRVQELMQTMQVRPRLDILEAAQPSTGESVPAVEDISLENVSLVGDVWDDPDVPIVLDPSPPEALTELPEIKPEIKHEATELTETPETETPETETATNAPSLVTTSA